MTITLNMIVEVGAAVAVVMALFRTISKIYELVKHQEEQDQAIKDIKSENALIIEGLHACLDGLEQLNCNHTVPATKKKLYKHLNEATHR